MAYASPRFSRVLVSHRATGKAVGVALTDRAQATLDFERSWWTQDGPKDQLIRERFQCSADTYYQELNQVLADPDALAYDPLVVRRLLRLRDRRLRARLDSAATSEGNHA
jgi:Protein of unknown function (DUF3263)